MKIRTITQTIFVASVLSLLCSCGTEGQTLEAREHTIPVRLRFADQDLGCGSELSSFDYPVELVDARFYVSDLKLGTGDSLIAAPFVPSTFQQERIALLDFEDGSAGCQSGTTEKNTELKVLSAATGLVDLEFSLGIPPELNHQDVTTAEAPLNQSAMSWPWQKGYKYLKIDFAVGDAPKTAFNIHLGAAGCTSASPAEAPSEACSFPNLATLRIEGFDLDNDAIEIDVESLLGDLELNVDGGGAPGCMLNPDDTAECGPIVSALGMDLDTGLCVSSCQSQEVVGKAIP